MFIYLSKKIAIPNGVKLKSVSWNSEQGWIACGGENGLLKVLKLDQGNQKDQGGESKAPAASNLTMNQTLEGHNGGVMVVNWNENYRKLTTSDQYGLIIVWMLHKGMWFEEMINNRNKSVVRDMKWTADGQKICIIYEDGAVIVGSVDGNRLWGKELSLQLCLVEWSPDGRMILFCTIQGECHIYDSNGNPVSKLPMYLMEGLSGPVNIIGIDWYDGLEGFAEPNAACLALGLDNGRVQLTRNETDEKAILIDTGLRATRITWNTAGTVLAVAGSQMAQQPNGDVREVSMVQFYSYTGQHLRTLRVPGSGINALSWEGGGLRISLAVDSYIYFANVRPDHKWGYFENTLVYAFNKPERSEHCVMFWDTATNDRYAKYVKRLMTIRACGEYCVLATKGEEPGQYILILCNAIGSPLDSKYIEVEPMYVCMTAYHVIVASEEVVYVWQYRTLVSKLTSVDAGGAGASMRRKDGRERMFHIDEVPQEDVGPEKFRAPMGNTSDPACSMCASDSFLLIGRESGVVSRYSLPHLTPEPKLVLRCRPQVMQLNCDSTRMSIIDINGVLTFFDLTAQPEGPGGPMGEHLMFERKDTWDMLWSTDNPELFAMMEKTRMYIFRGLEPEEPVLSSGYLCNFSDLQIKAALLDDLMRAPDHPEKDALINFETKSLRDTRHILDNVSIEDCYSFVEDNSHPRLWRILAEHALERLDFVIADKAFVRSTDYQGIQFVKRLQKLDDPQKQRAEVCAYFKRFDEAEAIYTEIDRVDLAIEMRMRLGDWFKVEKLVHAGAGDDQMLTMAWNKIGEYYSDRQKWGKAVQYYAQAKNTERLIECFYVLEDFAGLEQLILTLPDGSPLLNDIGGKFQSVGLCEQAVAAFIKGGDIKEAVDTCMLLNQWDQAVTLAERHGTAQQTEAAMSKYANHLLEADKPLQAIELYRKANKHTEAAKLLVRMAKEQASNKVNPLRVKKMYVLAALEVERFRRRMLDNAGGDPYTALTGMPPPEGGPGKGGTKTMAAATLDGLMTLDAAASGGENKLMDNAWHGAEAYHFWLLAHRQMYAGNFDAAMRTAIHLCEYDDVLDTVDVYSFLALASFYNRFYNQGSKAFIKLESDPAIPAEKRESFADLALSIFSKHAPNDPRSLKGEVRGAGAERGEICVASGRLISEANWTRCKMCKHAMISTEVRGKVACPLCHSSLAGPAAGGRAPPAGPGADAGPGAGAGVGAGGIGGYGGGAGYGEGGGGGSTRSVMASIGNLYDQEFR